MPESTSVAELFGLGGRVALVTGASSGLGRRMALALAGAGAAVVCLARRRAALDALVAEIEAAGGRGHVLLWDLSRIDDLDEVACEAGAAFGAPDILVNAAGANHREPAEAVTLEHWNATLHLNLSVPFFLARILVPGMFKKGEGAIINIASLQSYRAFANSAPYGASKGGIAQLTRAMAEAWSGRGVRANAIAPGFFPTELTAPVFRDSELADRHACATAVGRNGALSDIDGATIFLASPASAYVTGHVLPVDGGYLAK